MSNYKTIKREETAKKYPNIYKYGVVAIITAEKNGKIVVINERKDGTFSKPRLAFI